MPSERTFQVRNLSLAGLHWQREDAVKILALHGWLDNAASFEVLADRLPGAEILALDLPGHGRSAHRPDGEVLHYADYIADVHAVLDQLRWRRCVLLGHSMGAGIASLFAAAFPDRLAALVCLDGLGPVTEDERKLPARLARAVRMNETVRDRPRSIYPGIEAAVEARHNAGDLARESAARLVGRSLEPAPGGYAWRSDARLRLPSMYYFTEEQVRACLRRIRIPVLLVRPRASAYKAETILFERAGLVPNLKWVAVHGGHHAHMDAPEEIASHIDAFIRSVDAAHAPHA